MEITFQTAVMIVAIIYLSWQLVKDTFLISYCHETSPECLEECTDNCDYNDVKCSHQCSKTCKYNVQCDYEAKDVSSDILYFLDSQSHRLADHLVNKYGQYDTDRARLSKRLKRRYRGRTRLVETDPGNKDEDTAFVIDKGWLLSLCIRKNKDKTVTEFHKRNFLTFVLIHELSHIASNVNNHPRRFWSVFKWLLYEAKNANPPIYYYIDFSTDPVNYCGILNVSYTPEWDEDLDVIQGALTGEENMTVSRSQESMVPEKHIMDDYEKIGFQYDQTMF